MTPRIFRSAEGLDVREAVRHTLAGVSLRAHSSTWEGVLTTILASMSPRPWAPLKRLNPAAARFKERAFHLRLDDGTNVGGLLFQAPPAAGSRAPLLIAGFGLLQDRWGSQAAKFYQMYLQPPARLAAHVLILDHPSSAPFLAANRHLSLGAYDEARMWIGVAQHLLETLEPNGITLLGVSMSGQGVVHALLEDRRRRLNLFQSGIAISIAPDFGAAPGRQFALLPARPGRSHPWPLNRHRPHTILDLIQREALLGLFYQQFLPQLRRLAPQTRDLKLSRRDAALYLRQAFERRLRFLGPLPPDWNPAFSLASLERFMAHTRVAGLVHAVRTPLVLVSARDDPAVPALLFREVCSAAAANPWVLAVETPRGGHFAFEMAYGRAYLGRLLDLMLDRDAMGRWQAGAATADLTRA